MKALLKLMFVSSALVVFPTCKNETNAKSGISQEHFITADVQAKNQEQCFIEE